MDSQRKEANRTMTNSASRKAPVNVVQSNDRSITPDIDSNTLAQKTLLSSAKSVK